MWTLVSAELMYFPLLPCCTAQRGAGSKLRLSQCWLTDAGWHSFVRNEERNGPPFIHAVNKHLLNVCYVPCIVLSA